MRISIIAIGSRGDVQPLVALGSALKRAGHRVRIATDRNFKGLVERYELEFYALAGDIRGMLGRIEASPASWCSIVDRDLRSLSAELIRECREISEGADLLLPQGLSYLFCGQVAAQRLSSLVWIVLGPMPWRPSDLFARPTLVLLGYSSKVVPRPTHWDPAFRTTGYWFLDPLPSWKPEPGLIEFLEAGPPPVYIGFGSMADDTPEQTTHLVTEALNRAKQRGVLDPGWGGLGCTDPKGAIFVTEAPHSWLLRKTAAIVHHGGGGTVSAGIRAGIPQVLVPTKFDQFYWGRRVEEMGLGPRAIPRTELNAQNLAEAIDAAVHDHEMRANAVEIGDQVRSEDGIGKAIAFLQPFLT